MTDGATSARASLQPAADTARLIGAVQFAQPYVQLVGSPAITGQASATRNDMVAGYGSGFCGTVTCPGVAITVDGMVVQQGVPVQADGTMRAKLGPQQATVATAHKIARVVYHLLKEHVAYAPTAALEYDRQWRERELTSLQRKAATLGYSLAPNPQAAPS